MMKSSRSKTPSGPLERYWAKRDFGKTSEPRGEATPSAQRLSFVVQKHAASRLHYDFRLELDGVLLSWAVPKGPSFDPAVKRMAIHVEDHPLAYGDFEGTIPPRQYGAGTVIVWDRGEWEPLADPRAGLQQGKLVFALHGHKLQGTWELVRTGRKGDTAQTHWLLFKKRDAFARAQAEYDVVSALPDSVKALPPASAPAAAPASASASAASPSPAPAARKPSAAKSAKAPALPGARKAPLPEKLSPQLATLAAGVPAGDWLFEIKFDGYRLLARIERGRARLFTRNGHDWSERVPHLVRALSSWGLRSAWLDGEIVAFGAHGMPDFNALQNALGTSASAGIVFYLFDLPYLDGQDLRGAALRDRREALRALLAQHGSDSIRFSEAFEARPEDIVESACRMHLEGVIAKRADAAYESRRSESWLKLKCKRRQEFVVAGYTPRSDRAQEVGSLLLGVHDEQGRLVSVGSVGTGWSSREAAELQRQLKPLEMAKSPFDVGPPKPGRWSRRSPGSERWVQPTQVAEVEFAEWTPDGQIRHAAFVALRSDKPASQIVREHAVMPTGAAPAGRARGGQPVPAKAMGKAAGKASAAAGSVKISHPERVIDASTGLTKLDLVRYYESVAERMLPHLKGRPVSLVRGPEGVKGPLFFQKHDDKLAIPGLREWPAELWPGHAPLIDVPTVAALVNGAQMNVIEWHTWNSRAKQIDKPDRMVFDLDPGEGTPWPQVQEAAVLVRALLRELRLESWLKTSGGKGLHVVVPLSPRLDYPTVKAFSQAVVQHLARMIPSRFVAKSGPSRRVGKVFVDYLRNGQGATTVAAFSARARPGLGVSVPVSWDDLPALRGGDHWSIANLRDHLSFEKQDPWAGYWKKRQTLTAAMKLLPGAQRAGESAG